MFFIGFEVIIQLTIQILVLLLNRTDTPTTGGLETLFDDGKKIDAITVFLILSIIWSLFSTIKVNTNITILEKGFCPTTSKLVVLAWSTFAILRRVLSLVALFIPSLGLFSLLHHFEWDKIPVKARQEYAKKLAISPDDKIRLHGLDETIYWSGQDRWDYTDPEHPTPPDYPTYTLPMPHIFIALTVLSIIQFVTIFAVKIWNSKDFRMEYHWTNKGIHVLENLNFASPFTDWDDGDYTIQEFKERAKAVHKEVIGTQTVNFLATMTMLVPLWFTGLQNQFNFCSISIYSFFI